MQIKPMPRATLLSVMLDVYSGYADAHRDPPPPPRDQRRKSGKVRGMRAGQVPDGELLEPYDWGPDGPPEGKPFVWPEK